MSKNILAVDIGQKIRMYRKGRSITQKVLAEAIGVDEFYFGQVERGEKMMSLSKLIQICEYFEITLNDLIEIQDFKQEDDVEKQELLENINSLMKSCSVKQLQLYKALISLLSSY